METTITPDILTKTYSDIYERNTVLFEQNQPEWLSNYRKEAIADFSKLGFPTKSERYKYTNLSPFFNHKYGFTLEPSKLNVDVKEIFKCDVPELGTHVVLLINGFYYHKNEPCINDSDKIWVGSLREAITEKPEIVSKYLGKIGTIDDSYIALNSAIFRDGIFVYVPKGLRLEKPLQIINVLLSDEDLFVTSRNLIVLEDNSSASVVFCDHTLSPAHFLSNSVTEVYVGSGAHFDSNCLQNEHNDSAKINNVFINQEKDSVSTCNTFTLHAGLVRNNIKVTLNGEGAESNTSGLFLTDGKQHVDNFIFVHHAKPHCTSNQMFKGVLDHESTGSFTGKILVDRDAQKTAAYQKNSNLLLTSDAKMTTRPQLEIYADDVKCSHGATVGQLDLEAMFYMQARGIGKEEARLLLMFAFAHEIIQNIKIDNLKFRIDEMVNRRLRGELTKCHNCQLHV